MPLTSKDQEILSAMKKEYGSEKGDLLPTFWLRYATSPIPSLLRKD